MFRDKLELFRTLSQYAAWGSIAFVAFVTLSPIELRPIVTDFNLEHFGAFAVIGAFFGLAYPKFVLPLTVFIFGTAIALELAQHLVPGRHGRAIDLALKLIGGGAGIGFATMINTRLTPLIARQAASVSNSGSSDHM